MTRAIKPFRLVGASRASISAAHTSLVNACLWWCKAHGIKAHKHNSGATATARGGFVRYGFAGCPDILGVLPGGKHLAIEVKTGTGKLTPDQKAYRDDVEALGAVYVLARSLEDLERVIGPELRRLPGRPADAQEGARNRVELLADGWGRGQG